MQVTVEPGTEHAVLHLRGELDTLSCSQLQDAIDRQVSANVQRIVLNLRLVKFINSTSLNAIVRASGALTKKGGKLAISNPSVFCKHVMEKVGVARIVPVFESDEAAVSALLGDQTRSAT